VCPGGQAVLATQMSDFAHASAIQLTVERVLLGYVVGVTRTSMWPAASSDPEHLGEEPQGDCDRPLWSASDGCGFGHTLSAQI
jgi:hypothetical protein